MSHRQVSDARLAALLLGRFFSGVAARPGAPDRETVFVAGLQYFDSVTLLSDGIRVGGVDRTFADLGLGEGATVTLHARELNVDGVPPERSLTLVADKLNIRVPAGAFTYRDTGRFGAPFPRIDITAEHISGPLAVVCAGRPGAAGAWGEDGEVITRRMIDEDKKPFFVEVRGTDGTDGQPGKRGGGGGSITVRYVTSSQPVTGSAPGGPGGAGGRGGKGGVPSDPDLPRGDDGTRGADGAPGPPGAVQVGRAASPATLWTGWGSSNANRAARWGAHRIAVAEHHYRLGTPEALQTARLHLDELVGRPGADQGRVLRLLLQMGEGATFGGRPRDMDVTPDLVFAAQDNAVLLQAAQGILSNAATIAGVAEIKGAIAADLLVRAQQGSNTLKAADLRAQQAEAVKSAAASQVDLARARAQNLNAEINELRKELTQTPGALETLELVVKVGVAVAGIAINVGAGAAAMVDVGKGFAELQDSYEDARSLAEAAKAIQAQIKSKDFKKFVKSLKDVGAAGKSIIDYGSLAAELTGIVATDPNPKMRELAAKQRDRVLLERDIALQTQVELGAKLGLQAARAEEQAIRNNVALVTTLGRQLEQQGVLQAEPVLRALLQSVRQVLDLLSARAFLTLRAREIYLALDPLEPVRHDVGHLHPDVELLLGPAEVLQRVATALAAWTAQVISWGSLVDEMAQAPGFSRSPVPFWFSTQDAALLGELRSTGHLGFTIPLEDLMEEDGSQIFEAKLDSVELILHGASIKDNSGQSVKLRQLGRWSVRRRDGTIKDYVTPPSEVHVACSQRDGRVEGEVPKPFNERAQPPPSVWGRGVAGEWELFDDGGVDLSGVVKVEIGFMTQALSTTPVTARAAGSPRLLRPLPGWPAIPAAHHEPRPGPSPIYGLYGSGVAAVGLELI